MKKIITLILLMCATNMFSAVTITMEQDGGVYKIPCKVNGAKMKFVFDTGASSVCISEQMAEYLLDNDYISASDFLGEGKSEVADGRVVDHIRMNIKDLEIAGLHLYDVEAIVIEGQKGSLLLGLNALERLGKVTIDGNNLIINDADSDELSFSQMLELAKNGDSYYQFEVGNCYLDGINTEKNYSQAVYWFRMSSQQGNAAAYNNLGFCYDHGYGVDYDKYLAFDNFRKAFELGDNVAEKNLNDFPQFFLREAESGKIGGMFYYAYCCERGYGIIKNYYDAFKWYKKGAEEGDMACQNNLGLMYLDGQGTQKDIFEGLHWIKKSANNGNGLANRNLAKYYRNGVYVEQDYSEAFFWDKKAAELNDAESMYYLGYYYYNGLGVNKDIMTGISWIEKASKNGYAHASYTLGTIYQKGIDGLLNKDLKKAFQYFQMCPNDEKCIYEVVKAYQNENGVDKDMSKAFNILLDGAYKLNSPLLYNELAYWYAEGREPLQQKDFIQAHEKIDLAIKKSSNNPNYYDSKGELYLMQKKYSMAKEYYLKAISIDSNYYKNNKTPLGNYFTTSK